MRKGSIRSLYNFEVKDWNLDMHYEINERLFQWFVKNNNGDSISLKYDNSKRPSS